MIHSTDDKYFTSYEAGMGAGSNGDQEAVLVIVDGEDTMLHAEFAALEDSLPKDIHEEDAAEELNLNEEAESADPKHTLLSNLHHQVVILSSTIRYIRHLELSTERLRKENTSLEIEKKGKRANSLIADCLREGRKLSVV
jgi:hypothetical protein